ncbi:Anti-anti-sigma regulatory factor (antagonist of anti-sigma factor) [Geoalkalibacter ferrihydriticus]|uniref:Anti-anti-sigma regulatory factor (Antagonist of anti-sigma factor) n=1 Tax=Geoalkalibacter ferrihydriticus TaxID=392333 RepID=A0A1G9XD89_9BACT|nr:STAS domain-containing protein [Geoalkalibacter ferrihydriticus]SDM94273.1 Anti-anti-sigma regulatory factor (antagonist of anti-sigma factor) [Geoalkalibacter ferrihydriticus]
MSDFVWEKSLNADGRQAGRLHLGRVLTVVEAAALRETLMQALESCADLVLDGADVGDVDVAGLQALCAAHRAAVVKGCALRMTGLDAGPWPEVLRLSGLSRHEACPMSNDRKYCLWL